MPNIFWLQFSTLTWKNWIVISRHPYSAVLRCLLLPIAYGVFLSFAQGFVNRLNNYGMGSPAPIKSLEDQFDGSLMLLWVDETTGLTRPRPDTIMSRVTQTFTSTQLSAVEEINDVLDIGVKCRPNFSGLSSCFAGVVFNDAIVNGTSLPSVNYTIMGDGGLRYIDVKGQKSDFERQIFPLQWALDKAIIELQTGIVQRTPLEWPYSIMTNEEQATNLRLSYVRGIREIIILAFFLAFATISYQVAGSVANERALLITGHMKAMGLLDAARMLSWQVSISLTYLPGWVIVALIWKARVFVVTDASLLIFVHLLLGMVLASWSLFVAAPFGTNPQLAAVVTLFLGIATAVIGHAIDPSKHALMVVFSLICPPSFYIFAMKAICGFENHQLPALYSKGDPDHGITLLPFVLIALVNIFLWPIFAVYLERWLYETISPKSATKKHGQNYIAPGMAISIRNLTKVYSNPLNFFSKNGSVTAVSNLSLDIPKTGIFVLLGSNGAGKSTSLSILAGLSSITDGTVTFEGGLPRPLRGDLGIVPQKDVLFDELTCLQTLEVWKAVKWSHNSDEDEDLEQLLIACDLEKKIHYNAGALSGGQKRKLQLAIGLLGGSKIVLVDECTSGVDPLSRRALWKTLTTFRDDRSIVFTTHFLDEADLLGDHIAILAAPGQVVASGSPVALKRDIGEGYSIKVTFDWTLDSEKSTEQSLLQDIRRLAPKTYVTNPSSSEACFHLRTRDSTVVEAALNMMDAHHRAERILSYDILGPTIEDVFLSVMNDRDTSKRRSIESFGPGLDPDSMPVDEIAYSPLLESSVGLGLTDGRSVSPFRQAFTVFHKRALIAKRAYMTPLLAIAVAVMGACVPLVFIKGQEQPCTFKPQIPTALPLFLPASPPLLNSTMLGGPAHVVDSPPGLLYPLDQVFTVTDTADNTSFVNMISANFRSISTGGVSVNEDTGESLFAWEATVPGVKGASMLNLASNALYSRALNMSSSNPLEEETPSVDVIFSNYTNMQRVASATLVYLKWLFFFGAVMAVYPAFYAIYVSKERRTAVQAMQLSNGLNNPIGMWLGHLMFDMIPSIILSTIIVIVFSAVSDQFRALGLLWIVMVLYAISGTLFSYALSLMVSSPLGAFAISAVYQFLCFIMYLSAYLLAFTYAKLSETTQVTTKIHFLLSFTAPIASLARATLVSVNLFSLLCNGSDDISTAQLLSIDKFGGPILYLILYSIALLIILVFVDSGSRVKRKFRKGSKKLFLGHDTPPPPDVIAEANRVQVSDDPLRVLNVSKSYYGKRVTDDVSLGVRKDHIFALLGPNGAGKTTTFNIIRGDVYPDHGDIIINGASMVTDPRGARASLGVCPQFTAIDSQLTVREHLIIYGRFKGLQRGEELNRNIDIILEATSLTIYADRLAEKLSGGNQRKLALAIALMGNPSVILIDEFSTGVDPKMKRDMWNTLRKVSIGKAIVITTHSMEEASALADQVGILAKRMLAVGTIDDLSARYASYEVHFSCRSRGEVLQARRLMSQVPGSRKADDVATRFEVPIDGAFTLAQLFSLLSSQGDFLEYTVERASLESVFLKVVRGQESRDMELFRSDISETDAERAMSGFASLQPQQILVRMPTPSSSNTSSRRSSVDNKHKTLPPPPRVSKHSVDFGPTRISLEVTIPQKPAEQKAGGWYRHPTPQTARKVAEFVPLRPQGPRKYQCMPSGSETS
ncbi:hypothetical protein D9613_004331 [Agrocybe pediades]|uniref:ABC transporter domain-containing protein n=1 Tax=Agrocybe pediades TaxID=84607 RepID=A0A8H4VJ33_9AGAR|nr:hypothetical protein D9613_004331 [Agrocybe pediades]